MAGRRPQRAAPTDAPRASSTVPTGNAPASLTRVDRMLTARRLSLSQSYRDALDVEVREQDALDPDAVRSAVLREVAGRRRKQGSGLRVADALAASLIARAVDPTAREGVTAIRELADRTEGPVTQRIESASVRYVVSVSPAGHLVDAPLVSSTPEEWERMARADWEEARALPPAGSLDPRGGAS